MVEQQVIFKLNNVEYGIGITQVNEIVKLQPITKIPNSAKYVEGIINLRGKVIPIVDLKIKFNIEQQERNEETRIIVVNDNEKILGIIVDEVTEVISINDEKVEKSSDISVSIADNYIKGVAKIDDRLIILLELKEIFKG